MRWFSFGPTFIRRLNGATILFLIPWTILMLPGLPLFSLGQSVWYVTLISHIALIMAGMAAFEAARVDEGKLDAD